MKRYIALLCMFTVLSMIFSAPASVYSDNDDAVFLYVGSNSALVEEEIVPIDENILVTPKVEMGRTLVPARFLAETFGMEVSYRETDQNVEIAGGGHQLRFVLGESTMAVNGEIRPIDPDNPSVTAVAQDGRTLLPLRAFANAIGKEVFYERGLIGVSARAFSLDAEADRDTIDGLIARLSALPRVGSAENLEKLLGNTGYGYEDGGIVPPGRIAFDSAQVRESVSNSVAGGTGGSAAPREAPAPVPMPTAIPESVSQSTSNSKSEHSATNVQTQGVDEGDVVKTDGNYLYQVRGSQVIITKINPVSQMSVTSVLSEADGQFTPQELYIDGDRLTVIGHIYRYPKPRVNDSAKGIAPAVMPIYEGGQYTRLAVYDVSDREKPALTRTLEIEGNYFSSRRIGSYVYLLTSRWAGWYGEVRPMAYIDRGASVELGFDRIGYIPGFSHPGYLVVSSVDTAQPDKEAVVEMILGGGETAYVSAGHLYVAGSTYQRGSQQTQIYKFALKDGAVTYLAKGQISGSVLNQFSMDEYEGHLRIAATSFQNQSENHIYILDETMSLTGEIGGIAPGERIYSARFVGKRGYMVTFRQVDPLFVIDLANPKAPKILGQLKIPGYSSYIHPVDDGHIIGFGKDATLEGAALGMKMAMFDVSDVENPKEKFSEKIGDAGTDSELLNNHRALLWAPEKGFLAFPVTVREQGKSYGQLTFSGAYVYDFDAESGFSLRGKISHHTDEDMKKLGNYEDWEKRISRILYAGDSILTTSNVRIAAHDMDTVSLQKQIDLPTE